jgi:formylglycine-generating enzyme required for sulfatase activity
LNQKEGGNKYRLPTEAEWEYAARAGTTSVYSFGDDAKALGRYAWHADNSGKTTHPVGQKKPNGWGLYDMHGNVWEWVVDSYEEYSSGSATDPKEEEGGLFARKVIRGGCWRFSAGYCRSASRGDSKPGGRSDDLGFRLAFTPEQIEADAQMEEVQMEFVLIPAGEFMMGSPDGDKNAYGDEKPRHKVTISQPFYLGKYEVTQAQWEVVMGNNPSRFKGWNNPVEWVTWDEIQEFIKKLNQKAGGNKYRLPTEAEWEYAARAGTTSRYSFGDEAGALGRYAWYDSNSGDTTHPVGQKEPNGWGLYDMHGNVFERVQDWYSEKYYSGSPATDPQGPSSGTGRVFRSGSWDADARFCRSAFRIYEDYPPDYDQRNNLGFRLAFSPDQ